MGIPCLKIINHVYFNKGGRDSSVGIATRYGLDGPGIEFRWGGEAFRTRPDRPWGPPNLLYNGYRVFPGIKRPGRVLTPHPHLQCRSLKKCRAIPLPTLRALVAHKGGTFTVYLYTLTKVKWKKI